MTSLKERSDEELMSLYVEGNEAAFSILFERYAPVLLRTVRRSVWIDEDSLEIVQLTFLHLHRARHDYQPHRPLRPWVFTICHNLRREYFRRRARRPQADVELQPRMATEDPVDLVRLERMKQLRDAVARLPAAQREVIELHWFDELPFKQVAGIVGASETAVKVRAHRGYKRLRAMLEEES